MKIACKLLPTLITGIFLLQIISCQPDNIVRPVGKVRTSKGQEITINKKINTKKKAPFIFCNFPEQWPQFPGGEKALKKYLHDHIHYPKAAKENGIQGTVVVQFIIDTTGALAHVRTVGHKKGSGLEDEAIRVVKSMPHWIPEVRNSEKVKVQFSLPIRFVL